MAITTATIQHRRGNLDDFNPDKMVPGELAFTTDGSRKVFAAFAPGDCKELASTEEVQGIVDAFKQTAQGIVDDALHDIEEKADESLARIPEFADKANVIVVEKSGEVVTASDSSNDAFAGLNIYGKSTQETTTGKNLLPNTATTKTINGVTFTVNEDKSVTVNGTATALTSFLINETTVLETGNYILSGCPSGGLSSTYSLRGTRGFIGRDTGSGVTGESTAGASLWLYIEVASGVTVSNITFKPMIRLASITDATYEPYTGGIAAPNPDYPQEVVSCENTEVSVLNSNLFGGEAFLNKFVEVTNGNAIKDTENETVRVVASYLHGKTLFDNLKENTQYTLILKASNPTEGGISVIIEYTDGTTFVPRINEIEKVTNLVKVTDANKTVKRICGAWQADTTYYYNECGLFEGVVSLEDFEAYTKQSLTIPYTLCGIPVTDASIANYTDENGQMWVCDEVDLEKGVYVQRVIKNIYDGDEAWSKSGSYAGLFLVTTGLQDCLAEPEAPMYCSHYLFTDSGFSNMSHGTVRFYVTSSGVNTIYLKNSSFDTVDEFKTYLSDNPITCYNILAIPIETALTAEQIAEYKALHSNYPNTTVMNDSGAGMGVKFRADTQKHIEQNYVPVSEFQALVNRISTLETLALS